MNLTLRNFRLDEERPDRITIWIDLFGRSVNVLTEEVFEELQTLLDTLSQRATRLPLVFRSAKQKGFIVGADLRRIMAFETDAEVQAFLLQGQNLFENLERYAGVTIAVLQGPCLGGGLEFALACRYRFACDASSTLLGMPEAKLGLMPGWGGTQRLIERVGCKEGIPMLIHGEPIDAQRGLEIRLIDAIAKEDHFEIEFTKWLSSLTAGRPIQNSTFESSPRRIDELERYDRGDTNSLSRAQRAIYCAIEVGIRESRRVGFQAEREQFFSLLKSPEVKEKLQRFGSK